MRAEHSKQAPEVHNEDITSTVRRYQVGTAAVLYTMAALACMYVVLPQFSTAIIGPAEDNMRSLWNLWYGFIALTDADHALTFTRLIFYPDGASLYYNDYSFYNLFLSIPLQLLFNLPAVYNFLVLHSFILAGLGAFLLARYLTDSFLPSFIAGLLFAFCPTHIAQAAHHLNIASIQFLPFMILYVIRAMRKERRRDSMLLAALFYLLLTACSWTWGIVGGMFIVGAYIWTSIRNRRLLQRNALLTSAVTILPTLIIFSPWLIPMIAQAIEGTSPVATGHNIYVADLLAFAVPPSFTILGQLDWWTSVREQFTGNAWESIAWLGLVNILLAVAALRSHHAAVRPILIGSLVFMLFAMGTRLHVYGAVLPIPLPFALLEPIPILNQLRSPARLMVPVYLGLSLLSAIGLRYLLSRPVRHVRYFAMVLIVMAVVEYGGVITDRTAVRLPDAYAVIAGNPGATAVVDIPSSWEGNSRYMMYQTMHGLPIVQGLLPRRSDDALIDELAFLNPGLLRFQLERNRVSHIVVHRQIRPEAAAPTIELYRRHFPVTYADSTHVVFSAE